jgi:arsenate reductase-like glutaredoxin family protein
VTEVADAGKQRKGRQEALSLARKASRIIVARGKKLTTFDMKHDAPDDETLAAHILGPTGNLRAPTAWKGTTLLVGFSEDAYKSALNL